jgi:hypothetical protein
MRVLASKQERYLLGTACVHTPAMERTRARRRRPAAADGETAHIVPDGEPPPVSFRAVAPGFECGSVVAMSNQTLGRPVGMATPGSNDERARLPGG